MDALDELIAQTNYFQFQNLLYDKTRFCRRDAFQAIENRKCVVPDVDRPNGLLKHVKRSMNMFRSIILSLFILKP